MTHFVGNCKRSSESRIFTNAAASVWLAHSAYRSKPCSRQ